MRFLGAYLVDLLLGLKIDSSTVGKGEEESEIISVKPRPLPVSPLKRRPKEAIAAEIEKIRLEAIEIRRGTVLIKETEGLPKERDFWYIS